MLGWLYEESRSLQPDLSSQTSIVPVPGTLRPERGQPFAVQVEIAERKAGAKPVMVLCYAAVTHPVEAEDTLEDPERVLDLCPYSGLGRVLASGGFIYIVFELRPAAGHILRMGRGRANRFGLALTASISPDFVLLAVQ